MKTCLTLLKALLAAMVILLPVALYAEYSDDMGYLGYSKDLIDTAHDRISKSHVVPQGGGNGYQATKEETAMDETDAVQEQLTELGRSRSLAPQNNLGGDQVKGKLDEFWAKMGTKPSDENFNLTGEQKNALKARLRTDLEGTGYQVKQIELIDVPTNMGTPQVRGVVRVVRPLKSANSYTEIQNNLSQVKEICTRAATIEGTQYLCELTTFIAENPRNNYYYEKTILNP
ncbi:hypothetical protein AUK22_05360 [bacterium CG2_30_54_10]|nr:MAG: hypothetical protein AUK22_05360 [bacterium CG2_30_54_10]